MIGVIASDEDMGAVREFFELFKTPWEKWDSARPYDVVLCTTGESPWNLRANLIVVYSGTRLTWDPEIIGEELPARSTKVLCYEDREIPVYGKCITFLQGENGLLIEKMSGHPTVLRRQRGKILRVGYDLFEEVRVLLSCGQPVEQAGIPALELHIEFLRTQMRAVGIAFVEIPPVPEGYRFIVCLTHDLDHPAIRRHRWDHTAAGFLCRATIGALLKFARGRSSVRSLIRNWIAAAKWPFVQIGLAQDFWANFHEQYLEIDSGLPSTYFVIPFADRCGRAGSGFMPKHRAAGYGARDIEPTIRHILQNGDEIGLHGIDAWLDSEAGSRELEEIRSLTGKVETGVRMHWLYFDEQSPKKLECAGASYDSTIGYRETVGYRTGTTQAYMPPGAKSLIELPLHAMDTALFFPGYLGLTSKKASERLASLVSNALQFGGCLTINWHDRSLAPERLWDGVYRELICQLREKGAWFATAGQAVDWFRQRRSVVWDHIAIEKSLPATDGIVSGDGTRLPGLSLRTHKPEMPMRFRAEADLGEVKALDNRIGIANPCQPTVA